MERKKKGADGGAAAKEKGHKQAQEKAREQLEQERLAALIEEGKKRGRLSSKELLDVLEDLHLEQEQIDKFYDTLENLNIDITDGDAVAFLPVDEITPDIEELQEIESLSESAKTKSSTPTHLPTASAWTIPSACTSRKSAKCRF